MILLGLTGSIGMGKTTTAGLFRDEGLPVWDADAAVHALYAPGGAAVEPVGAMFPGVVTGGGIDRAALGRRVQGDADAFSRLEALVHPLVAAARQGFLTHAAASGADIAVLDVPLLFETGGAALVDAVVVVTAPEDVQRERVMSRPGMDAARFAALLERQTPDAHKRAHADFVIDTSRGLEDARSQVRAVLEAVRAPAFRSRRAGLDGSGEQRH